MADFEYKGGVIAPLKYASQYYGRVLELTEPLSFAAGVVEREGLVADTEVVGLYNSAPVVYNRTVLTNAIQQTSASTDEKYPLAFPIGGQHLIAESNIDSVEIPANSKITALIEIGSVSEFSQTFAMIPEFCLAKYMYLVYGAKGGYRFNYDKDTDTVSVINVKPQYIDYKYIKSIRYFLNGVEIEVTNNPTSVISVPYIVITQRMIDRFPSWQHLVRYFKYKAFFTISIFPRHLYTSRINATGVGEDCEVFDDLTVFYTGKYSATSILTQRSKLTPYTRLFLFDDLTLGTQLVNSNETQTVVPPYKYYDCNGTVGATCCAFPTEQSIFDYFADWGITATTSEDDVTKPAENPPINQEPLNPNPTPVLPNYPDNSSDIITINPGNIAGTDFVDGYIFNTPEAKDVIQWLKTNTFYDDIDRLYANPIDNVLSMRIYNIDFIKHDWEHVNAIEQVKILNVSHDLPCHYFRLGYNTIIKGGSITYIPYYGDYNDFVNTTYQLYVPYVGLLPMDASDVVNSTLTLDYILDIASGNSTYLIRSDGHIIKSGACQMFAEIPLQSSTLNSTLLNGTLTILSAAFEGNLAKMVTPFVNSEVSTRAVGTVGSMLSCEFIPPYLLITKYPPQTPSKLGSLRGNPATYSATIGEYNTNDVDIWVQAEDVKLSTSATETERQMIIDLIKSGIWV